MVDPVRKLGARVFWDTWDHTSRGRSLQALVVPDLLPLPFGLFHDPNGQLTIPSSPLWVIQKWINHPLPRWHATPDRIHREREKVKRGVFQARARWERGDKRISHALPCVLLPGSFSFGLLDMYKIVSVRRSGQQSDR